MNERTFELYLQVKRQLAAERDQNNERVKEAGSFRPVKLENRDDRQLWWGETFVCWTVHAMDGTATPRNTPASAALLERWPQLDPELHWSGRLSTANINRLRFRQCTACQCHFIGNALSTVCGDDCRNAVKRNRNLATKRKARQWHRENRDDLPQQCEHCGAGLVASRLTRRFCSDRCRKAASRSALAALEVIAYS